MMTVVFIQMLYPYATGIDNSSRLQYLSRPGWFFAFGRPFQVSITVQIMPTIPLSSIDLSLQVNSHSTLPTDSQLHFTHFLSLLHFSVPAFLPCTAFPPFPRLLLFPVLSHFLAFLPFSLISSHSMLSPFPHFSCPTFPPFFLTFSHSLFLFEILPFYMFSFPHFLTFSHFFLLFLRFTCSPFPHFVLPNVSSLFSAFSHIFAFPISLFEILPFHTVPLSRIFFLFYPNFLPFHMLSFPHAFLSRISSFPTFPPIFLPHFSRSRILSVPAFFSFSHSTLRVFHLWIIRACASVPCPGYGAVIGLHFENSVSGGLKGRNQRGECHSLGCDKILWLDTKRSVSYSKR